jgi:hypothetical protein
VAALIPPDISKFIHGTRQWGEGNEIYGRRVMNAILFSADRFNASTHRMNLFLRLPKHHFYNLEMCKTN